MSFNLISKISSSDSVFNSSSLNSSSSATPTSTALVTQARANSVQLSALVPGVLRVIFSFSPESLSECAAVNRGWKEVAYNLHSHLQQEMPTEERFGAAAWAKCLNLANTTEEPLVPMDFYKDRNWKLMFVPERIKIQEQVSELNIEVLKNLLEGLRIEVYGKYPKSRMHTHWVTYNSTPVPFRASSHEPSYQWRYKEIGRPSDIIDTLAICCMPKSLLFKKGESDDKVREDINSWGGAKGICMLNNENDYRVLKFAYNSMFISNPPRVCMKGELWAITNRRSRPISNSSLMHNPSPCSSSSSGSSSGSSSNASASTS